MSAGGREICADPRASIAAAGASIVCAVAALALPHWLAVSLMLLGASVWAGAAVVSLRATPPPLPPRSATRRQPSGAVEAAVRALEAEGVAGR